MTTLSPPEPATRAADLLPGVIAASSFAICNVLSKLVLADGADVLTLSVFRGLVGVALMFVWLRVGTPPPPHTPKARWIALGLGVLFAGVVFGLFAAIAIVTVPIAIVTGRLLGLGHRPGTRSRRNKSLGARQHPLAACLLVHGAHQLAVVVDHAGDSRRG